LGNDLLYTAGGKDSVKAGAGIDGIVAHEGGKDEIDCGPGVDVVTLDPKDRAAHNCEKLFVALDNNRITRFREVHRG